MTEFILYGPKEDAKESRVSLGEKYLTSLLRHHDKVAQVQDIDGVEVTVTHGELLRRAKAVAGLLRTHGLGSGGTMMLSCGNTMQYAPIMLGTFFVGAAVAPVNPACVAADMLHFLEVLQPQVVISNKCGEASLQEAIAQYKLPVPFLTMEEVQKCMMAEDNVMDTEFELGLVEDIETHVALVLCSSGTSGKPKSVELTHAVLLSTPSMCSYPQEEDSVILNMTGPDWITCQVFTMSALFAGGKIVILEKYDVDLFFSTIAKHKVTFVMVGPSLLPSIAQYPSTEHYDLSSIRVVEYGGAPAPLEMVTQAAKKFRKRMQTRYGMTECMTFVKQDRDVEDKPGNVGKVNVNTAAKVVDIETGKLLGPNSRGELCFRTPLAFTRYRRNPEATKDAFDKDGFLHTGDLGYYDNDGYFYAMDRIKDIYIWQGMNVSPTDIESVLFQHPAVCRVAVVAIPHESPQESLASQPTAFVVLRPGACATEEELLALVQDQLPKYKWLYGGVRFVDNFPTTATGKILKYELKKMYRRKLSDSSSFNAQP